MINMNKNMHKYPRPAHKNLDLHKDARSTRHKNPTIELDNIRRFFYPRKNRIRRSNRPVVACDRRFSAGAGARHAWDESKIRLVIPAVPFACTFVRARLKITFPKKRPRTVKAARGSVDYFLEGAACGWWRDEKKSPGFNRNLISRLPIASSASIGWNVANCRHQTVRIISFTEVEAYQASL